MFSNIVMHQCRYNLSFVHIFGWSLYLYVHIIWILHTYSFLPNLQTTRLRVAAALCSATASQTTSPRDYKSTSGCRFHFADNESTRPQVYEWLPHYALLPLRRLQVHETTSLRVATAFTSQTTRPRDYKWLSHYCQLLAIGWLRISHVFSYEAMSCEL